MPARLENPTYGPPTMDNLGVRDLTKQLADDFAWLEEHCRQRPQQGMEAGQLRLAASLVRNVLGPFLDNQPAKPLHVVVVGGAGAGKSTVANMLSGDVAAEANPQAGFTRHPIAYTSANGPLTWAGHVGFLGPLQRMQQPGPSSIDADVYQVRRVPAEAHTSTLLQDYVVWDCPDMTTWAASSYVPRLLEAAGLADILIYVASDERYNDEVPTQFLQLLLWTGKPVVACLMKMKEADVPAMVGHFQQEVLDKLSPKVVSCLAVPFLTPQERADPVHQAPRYRIPLLNQVAVLGGQAAAARRRTVQGAAHFLKAGCERLISAARQDVAALNDWQRIVQAGQVEFDNRYRREFLASEKLYRFDEAMVRLMDLLDLPGVGKVVSTTLWALRTPYRSRPSAGPSMLHCRSAVSWKKRSLAGLICCARKHCAADRIIHCGSTSRRASTPDLPTWRKSVCSKACALSNSAKRTKWIAPPGRFTRSWRRTRRSSIRCAALN